MFLQLQVWAFMLLQESGGARRVSTRAPCGARWAGPPSLVVIILFIMSAWSIGVMIDRLIAYNAARKQSRQFAPAVAGALREGKLDEAIKIADRYKKSHLAKVVVAGLAGIPGASDELGDSGRRDRSFQARSGTRRSHRARRTEARRFERWRPSVPRPRSWDCSERCVGIINAFKGISTEKSTGLGAVAGGISEALVTTAVGLFVAIPAVWMFNYFTNRIEAFDVEMGNSSSELIDYFLKRSQQAERRQVRFGLAI